MKFAHSVQRIACLSAAIAMLALAGCGRQWWLGQG